ncbi:MAG: serine/threonine-protein kinase [Candidatus Sumerlaeia bacterium]|nr:serine/threonine-protein kinase [Candidatus Sumerlaeia bacterium]
MDHTAPEGLPENATLTLKGTRSPEAEATLATRRAEPASAPSQGAETPSEGYRLMRRVASGGMGEVWEAVQPNLGRVVAVKRVRSDRLSELGPEATRALSEFRREALFAARLEHPNIVPVHDLAETPGGPPLLAMKYVQGTPWDRALARDFGELEPGALLGRHLPVLIAVGQAIAFAHSRGVVHRDLKPAQVMLGEFGEVLLFDWGLAMFVGGEAELRAMRELGLPELESAATATNPCGTPALMAPEQTERSAEGIGAWTDIYLLGGTLYFLLTGTYPHNAQTAHQALAMARAGLIEPPSRRAPDREIPADLEALCLSALEAEPQRRCPGAAEFVEALRDHLSGESRRRESRDLAARAEAALAAGAADYGGFAAAAALLDRATALWTANPSLPPLRVRVHEGHARLAIRNGDLVLARLQAVRLLDAPEGEELLRAVAASERAAASRARTRRLAVAASFALLGVIAAGGALFTRRLAQSRDAEVSQRRAAEAQRDLARDAREKSDDFARFVLEDMTGRLATLGRLELLDPAIERAFEYYASLPVEGIPVEERAAAARGLIAVMQAARARGNAPLQESAADAAARAVAALPAEERQSLAPLLQAERSALDLRLGDVDAGRNSAEMALVAAERELARDPDSPENAAAVSLALGAVADAEALAGDAVRALALVERALAIDERLAAEGGKESAERLAESLRRKINLLPDGAPEADAEPTLARILEVADTLAASPADADAAAAAAGMLTAAGDWHSTRGRTEEMIALNRRAVELIDRALAIDPSQPTLRATRTSSLNTIAVGTERLGDAEGASRAFAQVLEALEELRQRDPNNASWARQHLSMLNNAANVELSLRRNDKALALAERQLALATELHGRMADVAEVSRAYGLAHQRHAAVLLAAGRGEEALEYAERAVAHADSSALRFPGDADVQGEVANSRSWKAGTLASLDRFQEAASAMREAAEAAQVEVERVPGDRAALQRLAEVLNSLANYQSQLGLREETFETQMLAVEAFRALALLDPARGAAHAGLASALQRLSDRASFTGRRDMAIEASLEAMDAAGRALESMPGDYGLLLTSAVSGMQAARLLSDFGREAEAESATIAARRSFALLEASAGELDDERRIELDIARLRLGLAESSIGALDRAVALLRSARASRHLDTTPSFNDEMLLAQLDMIEAGFLVDLGRAGEAVERATSATLELARLREANPAVGRVRTEQASATRTLALALRDSGDTEGALREARASAVLWRDPAASGATALRAVEQEARSLRTAADTLAIAGRRGEALSAAREALALLGDPSPDWSAGRRGLYVGVRSLEARCLLAAGSAESAATLLAPLEPMLETTGDTEAARDSLSREYLRALAETRAALGDADGSRAAWERLARSLEARPGWRPSPRHRAELAIALLALGRTEEAQALRDEAAALDMPGAEILRPPPPAP